MRARWSNRQLLVHLCLSLSICAALPAFAVELVHSKRLDAQTGKIASVGIAVDDVRLFKKRKTKISNARAAGHEDVTQFGRKLVEMAPPAFEKAGVKTQSKYVVGGFSDENGRLERYFDSEFNPSHYLTIKVVSHSTSCNFSECKTSATLDLRLYARKSPVFIWNGEVAVSGLAANDDDFTEDAKSFFDKLIEQLKKEKLI